MNKNIGSERQSLSGKDLRDYWFKFFDPQTGTLTIRNVNNLPDENNPTELLENYSDMFEFYNLGNEYLPKLENKSFVVDESFTLDDFCSAVGKNVADKYRKQVKVLKINVPACYACCDLFTMFHNIERLEFNYDYSKNPELGKELTTICQFVLTDQLPVLVTRKSFRLYLHKPINAASEKHLRYLVLPSTVSQVSLQCVWSGLEIKINNSEAKIVELPSLNEIRNCSQATKKMRILLHKGSSTKTQLMQLLDEQGDEYKQTFYQFCSVVDIEDLEIDNYFKECRYDSIKILDQLGFDTTKLEQYFKPAKNQISITDSLRASLKIWFFMLFRHPTYLFFDKNYSFWFHRNFDIYCNQLKEKCQNKCFDLESNNNKKQSILEFVEKLKTLKKTKDDSQELQSKSIKDERK